jgi:polysaccharide export outer membrane protein
MTLRIRIFTRDLMRTRVAGVTVFVVVFLLAGLQASADEYEIGPGDVLHIAVFGQQDMTGDFTVDSQGMLAFPFLGHVKASAMATNEFERKLTTLLADGFLKRPRVSVDVKEYHSRPVFVTGEVQKPGAYGLRPQQSLLALVMDVGDLTPNAGHEIVIIRPPPAAFVGGPEASPAPEDASPSPKPKDTKDTNEAARPLYPGEVPGSAIFHISLRELRSGNPDKDFHLERGDTVYFPRGAQFYVTGYVNRPGSFPFQEGITVYQALALAGGVADRGAAGGVKIIRMEGGKRKELKAKPVDLVLPEDTIVVPERFF